MRAIEIIKLSGKGDCTRIGTGAGVHCVLDFDWPTISPHQVTVPESPYAPAMLMYGIDPDAPGLHYLQVNNRSIAEAASGTLEGNVASFQTSCVNAPPNCVRFVKIIATPEGTIDMVFTTWVNYTVAEVPYVTLRFRLVRQLPDPPAATGSKSP